MKAFILAAGLGTRLRPLTNKKPKALVEVNGIPLIEIIVKRLALAGYDKIIINVHHFADKVIDFLRSHNFFGIDITISDERNLLLDTGGALKKAAWFFHGNDPFIVHNVDALTNFKIIELNNFHRSNNKIATLAVQQRESSRYFLFDAEKNLCGWKNTATGEEKMARVPVGNLEQFAFSGIHAADPEIFKFFPAGNIFSLIDLFLLAAAKNRITYFDHTGSNFVDLGKKENLAKAEELFKNPG